MGIRTAFNPMGGFKKCPYEKEQVLFESSTPGTYTVEFLADGQYEVYLVGAGGMGRYNVAASTSNKPRQGGSGSGFVGIVEIKKGVYPVVVGKGDTNLSGGGLSSIGNLILAHGGNAANPTPGTGGAQPTINIRIVSESINQAGYNGTYVDRITASVYGGYGYGGRGNGSASWNYGGNGYVKIIYKGK